MAERPHPKPYTVSGLTEQLKTVLESRFSRIYVEAEISGWRQYPSGHAYFTLKDSGAQISAVMFANALARCKAAADLKDGAKVGITITVAGKFFVMFSMAGSDADALLRIIGSFHLVE